MRDIATKGAGDTQEEASGARLKDDAHTSMMNIW